MFEANVKISKEKNGPENVFLNTKGTKKKNYKCDGEIRERKRGRDCAYECAKDAGNKRKRYERALLTGRRSGKKLRAKEQSRNWRAIISGKLIPVDDNQRNKMCFDSSITQRNPNEIFMQQSNRRSKL